MRESENLDTVLAQIRRESEACWEQSADTPRTESSADVFLADWDDWGVLWDEAEECIALGDYRGARAKFDAAGRREYAHGGDRSHANQAIAALGTPWQDVQN